MAGLDITPKLGAGRRIVQGYGNGGFVVAGERWIGSVLVFPDRTLAWPVAGADEITLAALDDVVRRAAAHRILVVGCGSRFVPFDPALRAALQESGIAMEWMDTGAACRTFNVLVLEERDVAAALIAVA